MKIRFAAISLLSLTMASSALAQEIARVYAAGSLRAPLTEAATALQAQSGARVDLTFGASGLLRDRIRAGEAAQAFASANMEHPESLAAGGGWSAAKPFARNSLCALAPKSAGFTTANLARRLLDPAVRVGTSTPKADPSGDYAFEMFAKIAASPGMPPDARQRLEAKALQLTGGPSSPRPPPGRSVYGTLVAQNAADVFITYCTNAAAAAAEDPSLESVAIPAAINVGADYGLTVRVGATEAAGKFAEFLLSPAGRAILAKHGFDVP